MKWKQWGVDCHWLGIILFVLPGETGPSTDRQKGSVASLTFPFSSSQLALGCPFISIDSCSLRCLRGRGMEGGAGVLLEPGGSAWHSVGMRWHMRGWGLSGDGDRRAGGMHAHAPRQSRHTHEEASMHAHTDMRISSLDSFQLRGN